MIEIKRVDDWPDLRALGDL